ncbi:MAG: hypothetical protein ACK4N5_22835, partial [Myxococcales bacterium]
MALSYERYLGAFQGAPAELKRLLERLPALGLLRGTDWERGCYVPERQPGFDTELALFFRPVRTVGEEHLWLAATVGLSAVEQPVAVPRGLQKVKALLRGRSGPAFRRFELCASFTEPEGWESFRDAWAEGGLAEHGIPPVFEHLALIAHDFATWMVRERETFELGDPVLNAALVSPFPSALLIPPVPELLMNGLQPWRVARSGVVEMKQLPPEAWRDRARLAAAGDHGFLQL